MSAGNPPDCHAYDLDFLYRIGVGETLELKVNEAYGPVSTQLSPSDNAEGVYV